MGSNPSLGIKIMRKTMSNLVIGLCYPLDQWCLFIVDVLCVCWSGGTCIFPCRMLFLHSDFWTVHKAKVHGRQHISRPTHTDQVHHSQEEGEIGSICFMYLKTMQTIDYAKDCASWFKKKKIHEQILAPAPRRRIGGVSGYFWKLWCTIRGRESCDPK